MDQKQAEYWFKYASLLYDLGKLKEAYRFLSNIDRTNRTPEVLKLGGNGRGGDLGGVSKFILTFIGRACLMLRI